MNLILKLTVKLILKLINLTAVGFLLTAGTAQASDDASGGMSEMPHMPAKMMAAQQPMGPSECNDMQVWDHSLAMCRPYPMAGMPMQILMLHGNGFLVQDWEQGARAQNAATLPDMLMADMGSSLGGRQYLNIDFMGTLERWTFPDSGYPELLQIGESDKDGRAFIDDQHPHSSPLMGLTLSDTIAFGAEKNYVQVFLAPRGQSTDGPVAFMHRPTGMVNPDAPLGHHIGQDVGHISSTVAGAAFRLSATTLEVSTFNGAEPEPTKIDLPIKTPNSYAARLTQEFGPHCFAMISAAFVKNPEIAEPTLDHLWRYSASLYNDDRIEGWMLHDAFIYGLINNYDQTSALNSFAEEFWLHRDAHSIWGRIEYLQRTPAELEVLAPNPNSSRWVIAATLGYTQKLAVIGAGELGLGGSLTRDFLPTPYQSAYGDDPISAKIFLQLSGMKMWEL